MVEIYEKACRSCDRPFSIYDLSIYTKTFKNMGQYQVDKNGFYGEFGGAYVPEILYKCVHDLQEAYLPIIESADFKQAYHALLRDYVGRPSPLYLAQRMSERYGCRL